MTRGFSSKEALLGVVVLAIAGAIVYSIGLSMSRKNILGADAEAMRRVYVALSLYEESVDGLPAPDLTAVSIYLPEPACYQAEGDPYVAEAGPFPLDGGLPSSPRTSPYRISLAYLWAYRPAKPDPLWNWATLSKDSNMGFLANEWRGNVTPKGDFRADVSGSVLRVNRDGSLFQTPDRGPKPLGDVRDLFRLGR